MAASASDKARKTYSFLQKTLSSGISDVAVSLTPNNVTNIPTDTAVSFVVDRVDSNGNLTPSLRELMTGVVSGGTIASLSRGEHGTTAQAHSANAVIEFVNSGKMQNDMVDFLLQDHSNPNGNHKTLTDDNGNEWLERGQTSSAVNQVKITNAATGNKPSITANGDDTNIGLTIQSKGSGNVEVSPGNTSGLVKIDGSVPKSYFAIYDFVESGLVITADNAGTNKNYSISSGVVWLGGKRLTVAAVSAVTVGASKDRYIDVRDNSDGTAVFITNEVSNNAASQALTAGDMRIGIVVAGATTIANAASINQGQEDRVLPIASSTPYAVTDSLGNLICPRDPSRKIVGYRISTSNLTGASTSYTATALAFPVIVPTGRKVKITIHASLVSSGSANASLMAVYTGATVGTLTTQISENWALNSNTIGAGFGLSVTHTPSSTSYCYTLALKQTVSGTVTLTGASTAPITMIAELV